MHIRNRVISGCFKLFIGVCALAGICIQCGVFTAEPEFSALRYYTLLSNLLCAIYFIPAGICTFRGRPRIFPVYKGALIMGITVTGLIFHFMLSGGLFAMGSIYALGNVLLHYIVPAASVLDWLLFDGKGEYSRRLPPLWNLLPNIYFVLILIYAYTVGKPFYGGSRFPYFFIDIDRLGLPKVLLWVVALNAALLLLGYVFVGLDTLLGRLKREEATA